MANLKSSQKRVETNERDHERNSRVKSSIRTAAKKANKAIASKEKQDAETLQKLYIDFVKTIDTAARKGIVHKNTAARKKARMAKKVNALKG